MKIRWFFCILFIFTSSCGGTLSQDTSQDEGNLPLPIEVNGEEKTSSETAENQPTNIAATETLMSAPTAAVQPTAAETLAPSAVQPVDGSFSAIIARTEGGPNSFVLVGGSQNGGWVSGAEAADLLAGEQDFQLYTATDKLGGQQGQGLVYEPICGEYFTSVESLPANQSILGLTGERAVLLRPPQELPVDTEVYLQAVAGWLVEQMPSQPIVVISKIWRVDIEGDGTDEVFISATRFAEYSGHNVEPRDYSVVLMRKVIGNDVITVVLVGDHYSEAAENQFPLTYQLVFVGDLNGDGRMEVVIGVKRWEGSGIMVFEIDGSRAQPVLSVMCSL
ncbi:MAG: hypothetical protein OEY93_10655 [Anaerolineae bacterium]|nr:hypothetical protein [Anaerolineae bacterium]